MSTEEDDEKQQPPFADPTEEQDTPEEGELDIEEVTSVLAEVAQSDLPPHTVNRSGPRWEYLVFQGGARPLGKEHLDEFGGQGWQLASVCVLHIGPMPIVNYYFQRPVYDA